MGKGSNEIQGSDPGLLQDQGQMASTTLRDLCYHPFVVFLYATFCLDNNHKVISVTSNALNFLPNNWNCKWHITIHWFVIPVWPILIPDSVNQNNRPDSSLTVSVIFPLFKSCPLRFPFGEFYFGTGINKQFVMKIVWPAFVYMRHPHHTMAAASIRLFWRKAEVVVAV